MAVFKLDTDSFTMTLVRFVGRIGAPKEICSGNDTKFFECASE